MEAKHKSLHVTYDSAIHKSTEVEIDETVGEYRRLRVINRKHTVSFHVMEIL